MDLPFSELLLNLFELLAAGLKNWGGLHPFIVHFPVALLCLPPIFILLGLIFPKSTKSFYWTALILMLLGTWGVYLATSTGNAAAEPLSLPPPETLTTLNAHLELGEQTEHNFTFLSIVFFLYLLFFPKLSAKLPRISHLSALLIFLLLYSAALVVLLNTAHYGGRLVHEHGLRSALFSAPETIKEPAP